MWTAFGTPFRMSASYQVSVVLIESPLAGTAPLPVLTRGADDRGPAARPDVASPYPALGEVRYAAVGLVAALPGDTVTVPTANMPATPVDARLRHLRLPGVTDTVSLSGPVPAELALTLPGAMSAGPWALSLAPPPGTDGLVTNEVPLAVRPEVTAVSATPGGGTPARTTVTVTTAQPVRVGQRAALVVGSRQLPVPLITSDTTTPTVTAVLPSGTFPVRLLVDQVESEIADRAGGGFRTGPSVEVVIP
jgi:hypothetical protein